MEPILLSIILPVYNVASYLPACLDSILSQEKHRLPFEIIAVNDGSTDASGEFLADYQKRHPEVLKVLNTENHGVSHARNLGADAAQGAYLWFVDSDDLLSDTAFCRLLPFLSSGASDLILFGRRELAADGTCRDKLPLLPDTAANLTANPWDLSKVSPYPWDKIIRRDLWSGTRFPEGIRFEDMPVMLLTAARASSLTVLPECLYEYRTDVGFLGRLNPQTLDVLPALELLRTSFEEKGLLPSYREVLEFLAVKHCFLRFRQILWNYEPGTRALKEQIVTECFAYLAKTCPGWEKHPQIRQALPDFLARRWKLFSSPRRMHRFVRLCAGRPALWQRLYLKLFC